MSTQAEELLQMIVERAVDAEKIPVPTMWRSRIVDLCVRVVHKLITADAAVVRIAAEAIKTTPKYPNRANGARARNASLSAERRTEIAVKAATTRWNKEQAK